MVKQVQRLHEIQLSDYIPADLRKAMKDLLKEANVPEKTAHYLILAVDEIVSSVVAYSQFKGYTHPITLKLDIDSVRFKAELIDPMTVFDIKGRFDPARERRYKLSLFLIRQIVDELSYSYQRGFENKIELVKFL